MKLDGMLPFRIVLLLGSGLLVRAQNRWSDLTQSYCSDQNTGSDYDAGSCRAIKASRARAWANTEQYLMSFNRTEPASPNASKTTLSPLCNGRLVGAQTSFLPTRCRSVTAARTVRDTRVSSVEIRRMDYTDMCHYGGNPQGPLEQRVSRRRAVRLSLALSRLVHLRLPRSPRRRVSLPPPLSLLLPRPRPHPHQPLLLLLPRYLSCLLPPPLPLPLSLPHRPFPPPRPLWRNP